MDNVCHTLVGLAAARSGLNRTTRFATATLAIASNLPDLDVLVFATSVPSVVFRRGWTHGVAAQLVLPIVLAGVMCALARARSANADRGSPPARFGWLLALSYIGVIVHVAMDYLNNYGVRVLMPFSGRWFYGDALYIVDVWLLAALAIGTLLARRGRTLPARIALAASALYIVAMLVSARSARSIVAGRWAEATGSAPQALMVGPVPVDPFRQAIIVDAGDHYVTGTFAWVPRGVSFDAQRIPKNDALPAVAAARADRKVQGILVWSRFPFWTVRPVAGGTEVTLRDVRFHNIGRGGFSATTVVKE